MSTPLATVGILSIGQMGLGIAKLLVAHNYHVLSNVTDRSPATQARAQEAKLGLVETDVELVAQSDYILSIVPPKDAVSTGARIIKALNEKPAPRQASASPLYYLELNAVSPSTASTIATMFQEQTANVRFVDGGIIGGPPTPSSDSTWKRPGLPLSGPFPLHEAPTSGAHLAEVLNTNYLGARIGSASGLKCCFAGLAKGFTALAIQSFTTAASLDVLPALQKYLDEYNPQGGERARNGIVGCPSKAYRWVEEMHQIAGCFAHDGGWADQAKIFREVAGVYEGLAQVVERRGGTDGMGNVDGVVSALQEGLHGDER